MSRSTWARLAFLDDDGAGEAASELFETIGVRVVPERPRIRRGEFVDEAFARLDRRLGEARHAIHGVRDADAVPMDGRDLIKPVLDDDARRLALPQAQERTGRAPIVRPDACIGAVCACESRTGQPRGEVNAVFRRDARRLRQNKAGRS